MNQNLSDTGRRGSRVLWIFWGVLAGLAVGAALMRAGVYVLHDRGQATTIHRLEERLLQAQAELDNLYAQRDVLEGQLAVESSTRKGLEATLEVVQDELGGTRDQIAFFNELLPPGPEGSISIRGLDVQQKGSILNYRVLLMRNGASAKPFDGMLQFQATGRVAGAPVTVILEPVRAQTPDGAFSDMTVSGAVGGEEEMVVSAGVSQDEGTEGADSNGGDVGVHESDDLDESSPRPILTLSFDQFQRSSGVLQVPEGIELEEVTLNVFEDQTLRVSRTVDLPAQQLQH